MDPTDGTGLLLHSAAVLGHAKRLKKVLQQGISVDYPNSFGQTPLFCACAASKEGSVHVLLKHGADPNYKDKDGVTPVLVLCCSGRIDLLCSMIEQGGDLCLKDNEGDGVIEWAWKNNVPTDRQAMLSFLQQTQAYGKIHCAIDGDKPCDSKIPSFPYRPLETTSVMEIVKTTTGSDISLESEHHSPGFGHVYPCAKESAAIVSIVSLIPEMMLMNEDISYVCSLDFTMREMVWLTTEVSVKMLNSEFEITERANLILKEASYLSKLHHPNVILLMALCQPRTLDMLTLVFERVHDKNLFHYLYEEGNKLDNYECMSLGVQLCSAIGYIHNQGYIHCSLSSKAVYLSNKLVVKLGNFEFMMESTEAETGILSPVNSQRNISQLYWWMSPEIIICSPPSHDSDVFSFTCILWEMFNCDRPWSWLSAQELYERAFISEVPLELPLNNVPRDVKIVIKGGLRQKEDISLRISDIYAHLKDFKDRGNVSQNSQNNNSPPLSPGHSSEEKMCETDNLHFHKRHEIQKRIFVSTSAIRDDLETKADNKFRKNSSEGNLLDLEASTLIRPAIKPASHQQQPNSLSKTNAGLKKLNIGLSDKRNVSSLSSSLRDDDSLERCQMSVKSLAEEYQHIIIQHKLRQAILKGSMAPQGCYENGDSRLDTTKWHSLPSTIKECSKLWSPEEESDKNCLSGIGNLSCTPNSKKTSTPLHRHTDHKKTPLKMGFTRFLQNQPSLKDVGSLCRLDKGDSHMEMDITFDQATKFVEDIKTPHILLKSLVRSEASCTLGVSYHSPVIEARAEKIQAVDYLHNLNESQNVACRSNTNHPVHQCDESDPVKNFYLSQEGIETAKKMLIYELKSKNLIPSKNENDDLPNQNEKFEGTKVEKDSFWDLTQSSCDDNQMAGNVRNSVNNPERGKLDACSSGGEVVLRTICCNDVGCSSMERYNFPTSVGEVENENVGDKENLNATFIVDHEGDAKRTVLNRTFNHDDDQSAADSWVHDPEGSEGLSLWVSHQLDEVTQELMTSDGISEDCVWSVNSSLENLPHNPGDHLLPVVSDIKKTKSFEFEFQEYYIDDDLNAYERTQQSMSSATADGLNSNACTRSDPARLSQAPLGPFSLHVDRVDSERNEYLPGKLEENFSIKEKLDRYKDKNDTEPIVFTEPSVSKTNEIMISVTHKCPHDENHAVPVASLEPSSLEINERRTSVRQKVIQDEIENRTEPVASLEPSSLETNERRMSVRDKVIQFEENMSDECNPIKTEEYIKSTNFNDTKSRVGLKLAQHIRVSKSSKEAICQVKNKLSEKESENKDSYKSRLIPKSAADEFTLELAQSTMMINQCRGESFGLKNQVDKRADILTIDRDSIEAPRLDNQFHKCHKVNIGKELFDEDIADDDNDNKSDVKEIDSRESSTLVCRSAAQYHDADDCDSDEWLKDRLQILQEKIHRRRQRAIYTISSDEEDGTQLEQNLQESKPESSYSYKDNLNTDLSCESSWIEKRSISKHSNISQSKTSSCNSKRTLSTEKSSGCKSQSGQRQRWSSHGMQDSKECAGIPLTNETSTKSLPCRKFSTDSIKRPMGVAKSCGNLHDHGHRLGMVTRNESSLSNARSTESKSSTRAVMFEDETDGLRQFSQGISSVCCREFLPVPKPRRVSLNHGIRDYPDPGEDIFPSNVEVNPTNVKYGTMRNSLEVLDETTDMFHVDQLDFPEHEEHNFDLDLKLPEHSCSKEYSILHSRNSFVEDQCCITLEMDKWDHREEENAAGYSSSFEDKNCAVGYTGPTEVHHFYIPRHKWPSGCKARLSVDVCPTNPYMHCITTTAIDPVSGQKEVLMEKNVEAERLRSHLSID